VWQQRNGEIGSYTLNNPLFGVTRAILRGGTSKFDIVVLGYD